MAEELVYTGNQQRMTVEVGSNYTSGSGTLSLTAGNGAYLPAVSAPNVLFLKPTEAEISGGATYQVWKVTARSTDTLTVTGAQDGTTDTSFSAPLELEWTIGASALDLIYTGWRLMDSDTAAGAAAIVLDQNIDNSADRWMIHFYNIVPASDGSEIELEVSTDGGSGWETTAYSQRYSWAGPGGTGSDSGTDSIMLSVNSGNDTGESLTGRVLIWNPGNTSYYTAFRGEAIGEGSGGNGTRGTIGGTWQDTTAVNAMRIVASAGNISGTAKIYKWVDPS